MINVLIADDEARIRSGIKKRLLDFELPLGRIVEAADGKQALALLKEERIDIALVDINMPFVDGLTFISEGVELSKKTVFIIISGYNRFEYAQEAIKYGVFRYLLKPIDKEALKSAVEEAVALIGAPKGSGDPMLDEMIGHIARGYAKSAYSLSMLASALGVSEGYASKTLKKGTGMTFNEYLTKVRIDNARALFDDMGRLSRVGEVAARVGFSSQHYFSAVFKRVVGLTPSEYVEREKG
ncbi:response regulator [Christensenellaceae bacterium OttesenSCG-928-M15]|nr:response regulator [Christensenellaceae bacterium OttesenSCG-928-M15]